MGESLVDVGQHRWQELAFSHAGHKEAGGLQVPGGVCGRSLTGALPVGEQGSQEASEHSRAVAESRASSRHNLKQGEEDRVGLEAAPDVDVSLHGGAGVLLGGPGQFAVGHVRTDILHQRDRDDFGRLRVDGQRLVGIRWRLRAVEAGRTAALDDDGQ